MPRLKVDTSEAVRREALPDDTYPCTVMSISDPKQGAKASYVTIVFEVEDGHEFGKRQIWHNVPIDGKGAGIFEDFYEKVTGEDFPEDGDVDTDDLIGAEILVVTKQEEYPEGSGEFQNRVSKLLRA